jgi:hypothetical protein
MPTIEIDDELMAHLQKVAKPFIETTPNDVLRRIVFGGGVVPVGPKPVLRRPGALKPYLDAGLIEAGEVLTYIQPRKNMTYRASISPDGYIEVDGTSFRNPSPSLQHCTGSSINGWLWTYEPTEKTLNKQCKRK